MFSVFNGQSNEPLYHLGPYSISLEKLKYWFFHFNPFFASVFLCLSVDIFKPYEDLFLIIHKNLRIKYIRIDNSETNKNSF